MNIIESTVADAELLASIIRESNKDVAQEFGINGDNNPKHPSFCQKDWVESDFKRGEQYFIYQQNGVGIGCVAFENPRPGVGYLNRLSVLPEYRHQGIGEVLVRHIVSYGKLKDIQRLSIGIIADHVKLKNWYLKLGFIEGERKLFPHIPFDVLYMSFKC